MRAYLKEQEGLRVLDIGPTSATNINLLTSWGHSIYMSDLAGEATSSAWHRPDEDGNPTFAAPEFLNANLPVSDRRFDVVLFWDSADYLPSALAGPLLSHVHSIMNPGGKMLVFSHIKAEEGFCRYHLRDDEMVDVQTVDSRKVNNLYTNRQIEALLQPYSTYRFFLAKDNLREVLVSR